MIIKNNFNKKSVNPLDDYNSIGKGSHSVDHELAREKEGFIKENMDNPILEKLRDNRDDTIDKDENKWDFFK